MHTHTLAILYRLRDCLISHYFVDDDRLCLVSESRGRAAAEAILHGTCDGILNSNGSASQLDDTNNFQESRHNLSRSDTSSPSYFNQLPPELCAHIFLHCFPSTTAAASSCRHPLVMKWPTTLDWDEIERTRRQLTSVCRSWKHVIESNPLLWSSLRLMRKNINQARTSWLPQSGAVPLTLSLQEPEHDACPDLFYVLSRHSHRVHALSLQHLSIQSSLVLAKVTFPKLQKVHILSQRGSSTGGIITNLLDSSPHLYSLTWDGIVGGHLPMSIPWQRISEFTLAKIDVLVALSVFQQAADVVVRADLTISDQQPLSTPPKFMMLPTLQELSLRFTQNSISTVVADCRPSCILDVLIAPNLTFLHIDCEDFWFSGAVSSFIKRSNCMLRHLSIGGIIFPESLVHDIVLNNLAHVNDTLLSLRVKGSIFSDFLQLLVAETSGPYTFLPKLEELEIQAEDLPWHADALLHLFNSLQNQQAGSLKCLRVVWGTCWRLKFEKSRLLQLLAQMREVGSLTGVKIVVEQDGNVGLEM